MEWIGQPKRSKLSIAGWLLFLAAAGFHLYERNNYKKVIGVCLDTSKTTIENCIDTAKKNKENYGICVNQLSDCEVAANEKDKVLYNLQDAVAKRLPDTYVSFLKNDVLMANHFLLEKEIADHIVKNVPFYTLLYFGGMTSGDCIVKFPRKPGYKLGGDAEYENKLEECLGENLKKLETIKFQDIKLGVRIYSANKINHVSIYTNESQNKLKDIDLEDSGSIIKFDELFDYPKSDIEYIVEVTFDEGKKISDSRLVFSKLGEYLKHLEKMPKK